MKMMRVITDVPRIGQAAEMNSRVEAIPARCPRLRLTAFTLAITRIAIAILAFIFVTNSAFAACSPLQQRTGDGLALVAPVGTPTADASSTLLLLWESDGLADDPLDLPYGMAIDPTGNLWVSDSENDRFQIIAPDGTYQDTWGTSGSGDGEFEFLSASSAFGRPYGDIAFDAEGNVYVADTGNQRIQKFAPDRTFLGAWGGEGRGEGQFLTPISVTVSDAGVVYVCDEVRNDVQMFDRDGGYLGAFGGSGSEAGEMSIPSGVAIDPAGDVWVADWGNNRMQRFSADGEWRAAWGEFGSVAGDLHGPNDVVIDVHGYLYVADALNNRLQVFTPQGEVLAATGTYGVDAGQFHYALGLALDEHGVIYVSDRQRVQAFRVLLPDRDQSMP
jgi:DNA-binding beta-propeller fold protein YncE